MKLLNELLIFIKNFIYIFVIIYILYIIYNTFIKVSSKSSSLYDNIRDFYNGLVDKISYSIAYILVKIGAL